MKSIATFLLSIISITTFASSLHSQDTTEWTVVMSGNKAGFTKVWKDPAGITFEWFQYNDRGRGDSTVAKYRENDRGYLIYLDAAGKDYFKKPVFEKFTLQGGKAHWENNAENESVVVTADGLYISLKISAGTSFKSYFNSADTTVQLLPSGKQKLRILKSIELDGKKLHFAMTTGSGLQPNYFWMDDSKTFFASVSDWFSMIRKGYEPKITALIEIQKPFQQGYYTSLSRRLTKKATKIAVINALLFSPVTKTATQSSTILIEDGVIKEVSSKKIAIPSDYEVVDAAGKFVMPGLWDMHVHYGESDGIMHVASGVTNVRDMGNGPGLLELKKELEQGLVIGPRIQGMCGFIDGAGPYAGPTGARINSAEEGKDAVKRYFDLGYTQIKLYSSLKPEWVKPIADEAKKYTLRVSGHIPAHMIAEEAINAGYNEIQHMNMVFLNFYGKDLDTRTPVRFKAVAEKGASFNFNDPKVKKFIDLLKAKQIVIDPTVSVFENMFTNEQGKMSTTMAPVANRLPPSFQRALKSGSDALATEESQKEPYRKSFENMLKMINLLYKSGVTIVRGTDDIVGFVLHRELENYVKAGIPAGEVLRIATLQSAKVAGRDGQFGSAEKGKVADLIIIDGNPLQNISDIRKTVMIIKDQSIYSAKDLYESLSIREY